MTTKQMAALDNNFGVWIAYHSDWSEVVLFCREIDALRYAVENHMSVRQVKNAESIRTGEVVCTENR